MKINPTLYLLLFTLTPWVQAGKNFDIVDVEVTRHDRLLVPVVDPALSEVKTYRQEKEKQFVIVRLLLEPTAANFDIMRVWSADLIAMKGPGISSPRIWTGLPMGTRKALASIRPNVDGKIEFPFVFSVPEKLETVSLSLEGKPRLVTLPPVTESPDPVRTEAVFEVDVSKQKAIPEYRKYITVNKHLLVETVTHPAGTLLELQVLVTPRGKDAPDRLDPRELKLKLNGFYIEPMNSSRVLTRQAGNRVHAEDGNEKSNILTLKGIDKVNQAILIYPVGTHKGIVQLTHNGHSLAEIEL